MTWNKYSYALGSPLKFIDPDGQTVEIAADERLQSAVEDWRKTPAGERSFQIIENAVGVYKFESDDSLPENPNKLKLGVFKANYHVEDGAVVWDSGGTIIVRFAQVDMVSQGVYASDEGDAAIVAHEAGGHAADYERGRQNFVKKSYKRQERMADKHRDLVVKELRRIKKSEAREQKRKEQ